MTKSIFLTMEYLLLLISFSVLIYSLKPLFDLAKAVRYQRFIESIEIEYYKAKMRELYKDTNDV